MRMDARTNHVLGRISRGVPSRLARSVTKKVFDSSEEDLARAALKSPDISKAKKERIAKMLDAGKFRREEEVIDEEVVGKIDRYNAKAVARARRAGLLKDPMSDPFYRKRMQRIARGNFKRAAPLSKEEIANARRLLMPKKQ